MKILFVCENYYPHFGGAEVVFKNLAEGFATRDHNVALVTHQLKNTKAYETINNVKVHRIKSFNSRYLFTFLSIPRVIKLAKKADVIQTTTFNGAFPAWLAGKLTGKPVIITVHEVWAGKWQQVTGFSWWKSKLHDLLERAIYLLPFDKYVCVSNSTKKDLLKLKPKLNGSSKDYSINKVNKVNNINKVNNKNNAKAITIYNGLDYNFWNHKNFSTDVAKSLREELNLQENFLYFFWGRPGNSKGFEYAIKALPQIKASVPNAKLVVMFGAVDKYQQKHQDLLELIKKLNLQDDIKVLTSAPYEKLGNYIMMADAIIIPSIAEGFGYTTVESGALGKTVIVSNAGSLPEVVSGKHLIFKSKDVDDLAKCAIMVARGKYLETPLKKFLWKESIENYLEEYENLKRHVNLQK